MKRTSETIANRQYLCLNSSAIKDLRDSLPDRVDTHQMPPARQPKTTDKWLLSSALQKLIRRGRSIDAVGVAQRLHAVDPRYLARRLPIIAVEDVGVGDLVCCHDAFALCSESRWWRVDADQTIGFLVHAMAESVKSRAACDALCLGDTHADTTAMLPALLAADRSHLVSLVSESTRPQLERINALRVLGGITVRDGSSYKVVSPCDLLSLDQVAAQLELPPLVRWLMAKQRKSSSLAAMLPIAVEASARRVVVPGDDFPFSLCTVGGIPLCAVDMFSEFGRSALREFFLGSRRLMSFCSAHARGANAVRLLNMALFHVESSLASQQLMSPELSALTDATCAQEMRSHGMSDPEARHALSTLLREEASKLAAIRIRRLRTLLELDHLGGERPSEVFDV